MNKFKQLVVKYGIEKDQLYENVIKFICDQIHMFKSGHFLLRFDNERDDDKFTVLITISERDLFFRMDVSHFEEGLEKALIFLEDNQLIR